MIRRLITTIGIAVVALALTACGGEEPASSSNDAPVDETSQSDSGGVDDSEFRNAPVPEADPSDAWEKDLPEKPGSGASMEEQIAYELISTAAQFARQYDEKTEVDCPDVEGGEAKDVTCDMTYFGEKIAWDVSISGGSIVASYKYESDQRVMSREYIENALRFEAKTEDVMCELDGEYVVVNPEKVEPAACHSQADGEQTSWEMSVSAYGKAAFYEK